MTIDPTFESTALALRGVSDTAPRENAAASVREGRSAGPQRDFPDARGCVVAEGQSANVFSLRALRPALDRKRK